MKQLEYRDSEPRQVEQCHFRHRYGKHRPNLLYGRYPAVAHPVRPRLKRPQKRSLSMNYVEHRHQLLAVDRMIVLVCQKAPADLQKMYR